MYTRLEMVSDLVDYMHINKHANLITDQRLYRIFVYIHQILYFSKVPVKQTTGRFDFVS